MKKGYCIDGVTRFTDPFWDIECECGHRYWSVIIDTKCPKCGSSKGKALNNHHIDVDLSKYNKWR